MKRLFLLIVLSASTVAAKTPRGMCHLCKCHRLDCDNLCYHKHNKADKDFVCLMACHCNAVIHGAKCVHIPTK